jgi:phospholipase C
MAVDAIADISGGKMDGFIASAQSGHPDTNQLACTVLPAGTCLDVMGFHDAREIPHYWAYARNYVLQDHMFEPTASWSLPAHLYMISAWSAFCLGAPNPPTCHTNLVNPDTEGVPGAATRPLASLTQLLVVSDADDPVGATQPQDYAWTDITYLLHKYHVSWRYYLTQGTEPDCASGAMTCSPVAQNIRRPRSGTRSPTSPTSTRTISSATSFPPLSSSAMPMPANCPLSRG